MTREEFFAAGGTVDVIHRNPPESRRLATVTVNGRTVRGRGASIDEAIARAVAQLRA
jgi:hypothetical protein